MIQLHILSGKKAGDDIVVRRFPFVVGRASQAHLQLDEPGVWDRHCEIAFQPGEGFQFAAQPEASLMVNGNRAESGVFRNGDLLELGSVRLRFWLTPARQKSLRLREGLIWSALLTLLVAQGLLIGWLLS